MSRICPYLIIISMLLACRAEEDADVNYQVLRGRWELIRASVDGEPTDRLRDLYFVFLVDSSLQTNILGSEKNFRYLLRGGIIQQASDPPISYAVTEFFDSTLVLETEIRNNVFSIELGRSKPKVRAEEVD